MLVWVGVDTLPSALDVKPFWEAETLSKRIFPTHEEVALRFDQPKGIAKATANGNVNHWHRATRSARAVNDPMNEEVTRIFKIGVNAANVLELRVSNSCRVVLDAKVLLKHLEEEIAAEVARRIVVRLRRVDEAVPVATSLKIDLSSGLVEPIERFGNVQRLGTGQARSANQIQSAYVQSLKESVWIRTKLRQRWEAR
jgi:hypothetical protein